jgi:hypothetical protein
MSSDQQSAPAPSGDAVQIVSLLAPPEIEQLGGIPGEAVVGQLLTPPAAGHAPDPASFRVNVRFVEFLHLVIARWAPKEPQFAAAAKRQRDGWVYILDGRTPTPQGNVPPEDIIGAFEVQGGEVVTDSYQAFPEHRVFTERGAVQLTPFLRERFFYELTQLPAN